MLAPKIIDLNQTPNRKSYQKREFGLLYSIEELQPVFRGALVAIFGKNIKSEDLEDFATIAAFLTSPMSKTLFYELDEALQAKCALKRQATGKARLSEVIVEWLHADCGFSPMKGVVLNGDAALSFRALVGNCIIFKDGFSPIHGEFTHAFQWLLIALGLQKSMITLTRPAKRLCELYAASVRIAPQAGIPQFEGEFRRKQDFFLWDFIGDCFLDPENREDLLDNLLTSSCRGPANIQKMIMETDGLFLREYYMARFYNPLRMTDAQNFKTSIGHNDKLMQAHHHAKQTAKGKTHFVGNTWGPAELAEYLAKQE